MQRDWCDCLINMYKSEPVEIYRESGNKIKDFCNAVVSHRLFDIIVTACITLNTISMSLTWYDEPDELPKVLKKINLVFYIIYTIEAVIKI